MSAISVPSNASVEIPAGATDIQNLGSVDIYIDYDSGVTSSTGIKIAAGGSYAPIPGTDDALFARAASSTADVRYMIRRY